MYGNYTGELLNVIVCGSFCFTACLYFRSNTNIIESLSSLNHRISMTKVAVKKHVIDMLLHAALPSLEQKVSLAIIGTYSVQSRISRVRSGNYEILEVILWIKMLQTLIIYKFRPA